MNLYPYQEQNAQKGFEILTKNKLVYLHFEVRTGKTLTALEIAFLGKYQRVLFVTKRKAISSIESDYNNFGYSFHFELTVINYESLHKIDEPFDLVILDEAHVLGAFPKPAQRTKFVQKKYSKLPMIFLSGTPAVESSAQWFHQLYVSNYSPFKHYKNFYQWSKDYVEVTQKHLGYGVINDYTNGRTEKIEASIKDIVLTFTQEQAGFETKVNKNIVFCEMTPQTGLIARRLQKDNVVTGSTGTLTADSGVKLLNKLHQLSGGTVILDDDRSINTDYSKAIFIKETYKEKIAIFYYFKQELELLKEVYGNELTTDLNEFNTTDKVIALQQYSGAEGISLKNATKLIFYNWGMSGVKFIQAIDRMSTKDRLDNQVYFICGYDTISKKVLDRVLNKESYGIEQFRRDYGT